MQEGKLFYEKLDRNAEYELYDRDLESTVQFHSFPKLDNSA